MNNIKNFFNQNIKMKDTYKGHPISRGIYFSLIIFFSGLVGILMTIFSLLFHLFADYSIKNIYNDFILFAIFIAMILIGHLCHCICDNIKQDY